jgi:hypothetical protein
MAANAPELNLTAAHSEASLRQGPFRFSSELAPDGCVRVCSGVVGWFRAREWLGRRAAFPGCGPAALAKESFPGLATGGQILPGLARAVCGLTGCPRLANYQETSYSYSYVSD